MVVAASTPKPVVGDLRLAFEHADSGRMDASGTFVSSGGGVRLLEENAAFA
jgi:hypothetical protein